MEYKRIKIFGVWNYFKLVDKKWICYRVKENGKD